MLFKNQLQCTAFLKGKLPKLSFEGVRHEIFCFRHESWVSVHNFGHGSSEYFEIWVS